jgi:hypothetical protein
MTLLELKKSIHEKIDHVQNEAVLERIEAIIDSQESVFIIPEHMKEGIRQGKEDAKAGRVHSMEDFKKKYEKWLK